MVKKLSTIEGETTRPLWNTTLGRITDKNAETYGHKTFLFATHQKREVSFAKLAERSRILASALLSSGLKYGDHVGVYLPNTVEHLELFLATARIGVPLVQLNLTYTPDELAAAAAFTDCRVIFIGSKLGPSSLDPHHKKLLAISKLERLIEVGSNKAPSADGRHISFTDFELSHKFNATTLAEAEKLVQPTSVMNIQFTSGTTGAPKAACLTHTGPINSAKICVDFMSMTAQDRLLNLGPLFHVLGSIAGFLVPFVAGAQLIFASEMFDPGAALAAMMSLSPTIMPGVPTMYIAIAELARQQGVAGKLKTLRTGFVGGASPNREVLMMMTNDLGMHAPAIGYGITEISLAGCGCRPEDTMEHKINTSGDGIDHVNLRVVDPKDPSKILPAGTRGELLVASYGVFVGYYKQPQKTADAIYTDENGTRWFRSGDEAIIGEDGYLQITGRIKDIIIRGGENIYPLEIENRLFNHPGVAEACVVGIPDRRYGEVVAAFLRPEAGTPRPRDDEEIRNWVREKLARQKAPKYVFWLGKDGLPAEFPKTGTGKLQKHVLREMGVRILEKSQRAKL